MKNVILGIISVSLLTLTVACSSQYSESSPEKVENNGIPLEERVAEKQKVDIKIDIIQKAADKIKRIVDLYKKIQRPKEHLELYTPIDFLMDLNKEIKNSIPLDSKGKLYRKSLIRLKASFLSEECRDIETLLESSEIDLKKSSGFKLTVLKYSVKTCRTEEEFVPVFEVGLADKTLDIHILNKNIEMVLKDLGVNSLIADSKCQIKVDEKNILESVRCSDVYLKLSASESARIQELLFLNFGSVRFKAIAEISENSVLKATTSLEISDKGEVDFHIREVEKENQ